MSWLAGKKPYDRARILTEARRAAGKGKHVKAIALYGRVLEIEPENTDLLRRLAGQRVRAGQREEAWRDCRTAAERLIKAGFVEQAIGAYRDFATHLPDGTAVWGRSRRSSSDATVDPTRWACCSRAANSSVPATSGRRHSAFCAGHARSIPPTSRRTSISPACSCVAVLACRPGGSSRVWTDTCTAGSCAACGAASSSCHRVPGLPGAGSSLSSVSAPIEALAVRASAGGRDAGPFGRGAWRGLEAPLPIPLQRVGGECNDGVSARGPSSPRMAAVASKPSISGIWQSIRIRS